MGKGMCTGIRGNSHAHTETATALMQQFCDNTNIWDPKFNLCEWQYSFTTSDLLLCFTTCPISKCHKMVQCIASTAVSGVTFKQQDTTDNLSNRTTWNSDVTGCQFISMPASLGADDQRDAS